MTNLTQEKKEKVIEVLEQNGYQNAKYMEFLELFDFYNRTRDRYARLAVLKDNVFCVSTISSHWNTNEIDEYIKELQTHNKLAKELNEIINS